MDKKIKARIILPGSGIRAIFQMGFLIELLDSNLFEIDKVYGCSAGALLSPLLVTNKLNLLLKDMDEIKTIEDVAEPYTYMPNMPGVSNPFSSIYTGLQKMLGPSAYMFKLMSIVHMYFDLGLFKKLTLYDRIMGYLSKADKALVESKCIVVAYNITERKSQYFSGKDIFAGIQASSALWMLVPPIKIKHNYYTDGGVRSRYPIDNIDYTWTSGLYIFVDAVPELHSTTSATALPANVISYTYELINASLTEIDSEKLEKLRDKLKDRLITVFPEETYMENAVDIDPKKFIIALSAGRMKYHEFVASNINLLSKYSGKK
jgi:predicted acylesterase/phospholipase RssA